MKNLDAFIARRKWEKSNRRQHGRIEAAVRIRIVPCDGAETISGRLIDLSKSGARLCPMDRNDIPDDFDLELEAGLVISCTVVHRSDGDVGVRFILPTSRSATPKICGEENGQHS